MVKTEKGNIYYCPECDDFHLVEEFLIKSYGFICPKTKQEIKYWKFDKESDVNKVAKLLNCL